MIAWQKAQLLTAGIYRITAHGEFARGYGLRDQIRRATANIAEGFDRASRSEFHQFLVIAKASCTEVRSQLYVARNVGYLDQQNFSNLYSSSSELSLIIGGLRAAVQKLKR